MKKRVFAAITALTILCSLCACGKQEQPASGETTTGIATESTEAPAYPTLIRYGEYLKMTPQQQQAYYETFPDQETYMQWFNDAALAYNQAQGGQEDNTVDGNVGQITQPTETGEPADPAGSTQMPTTPTQKPTTPTQKPTTGQQNGDSAVLTYAEYLALSPTEQQAYYNSFSNHDAYMQWFNQAVKEHNEKQDTTQPPNQSTEQEEATDSALEGTGFVDTVVPPAPKR